MILLVPRDQRKFRMEKSATCISIHIQLGWGSSTYYYCLTNQHLHISSNGKIMMEFQRMTAVAIEVEAAPYWKSQERGTMAVTVREREFQIIISIFIICLYRIKCAFASLYFIAILCACACACATHLRFCHSSSLNPSYSLTLSTWESLNTTGINKNRKFERKDLSRKLFQLFSLFSIFRAFGLHIPHLPFPLFRRSQSAHTHTQPTKAYNEQRAHHPNTYHIHASSQRSMQMARSTARQRNFTIAGVEVVACQVVFRVSRWLYSILIATLKCATVWWKLRIIHTHHRKRFSNFPSRPPPHPSPPRVLLSFT